MGVQKGAGLQLYYKGKIEELELCIKDKSHNLRRLEAQRNELNTQGAWWGPSPLPL
jgi:26S proteasome regulatory subunit T6